MNGSAQFYLSRKLHDGEQKFYTEQELRESQHTRYVVILAEPGAGKSELMNSIAKQLGTKSISANRFVRSQPPESCKNLVIDALDELAGSSDDKLHDLFSKIENVNPERLVISSRSSEWNSSTAHICEEYIENKLINLWLEPFKEDEQRAIFDHHRPNEDFFHFQRQVARFDLDTVLPNPEFLKLLTDAYIESNREFLDKRDIFQKAITSLSKEHNTKIEAKKNNLTTGARIDAASEIFAKLLLAGCEGIASLESQETPLFPYLRTVYNEDKPVFEVLETKLFKPAEDENHHLPVHKIVSEYCAANYFVKRITNPKDELTLRQCLSVIAPNSVTRTELRGLLGWMAALGNAHTQETLIKLDPYAVLSNGDPSQLTLSSKLLLIQQLQVEEEKDPYFRRGDFWRQFSVAGFFTDEVIDELKKIISLGNRGQLKNLILELLIDSPIIHKIKDSLRIIVLNQTEDEASRILASYSLTKINYQECGLDIDKLLTQKNQLSIELVTTLFTFDRNLSDKQLTNLLNEFVNIYNNDLHGTINRHFIKIFISKIPTEKIQPALDILSEKLTRHDTNNTENHHHEVATSKVIGSLLDQLLTRENISITPEHIWRYTRDLRFYSDSRTDKFKSVEILLKKHELRRKIIKIAFHNVKTDEEINHLRHHVFSGANHSGLRLLEGDPEYIADLAFDEKNPNLWINFIPRYFLLNTIEEQKFRANRRAKAKRQARLEPIFMQIWSKENKFSKDFIRNQKKENYRSRRKDAQHQKITENREKLYKEKLLDCVKNNYHLIKEGKQWEYLVEYSNSLSNNNTELFDIDLTHLSLINCIDFIRNFFPSFNKIATQEYTVQEQKSLHIFKIACSEVYRTKGNLEHIDKQILKLLAISDFQDTPNIKGQAEVNAEINRLIFKTDYDKEIFLREYFEPLLNQSNNDPVYFYELRTENITPALRSKLSAEWLDKFPFINTNSLQALFEFSIENPDWTSLRNIIEKTCELLEHKPLTINDEKRLLELRKFWHIRAFYFLEDISQETKDFLKKDKDNVILFRRFSARHYRLDYPNWPTLIAQKIEFLLDSFIDFWPEVKRTKFFGSHSSNDEKAYRLLSDLVWMLDANEFQDAMDILNRFLNDERFATFHKDIKSILTNKIRAKAHQQTELPTISNIIRFLDNNQVISTDSLRALVIEELQIYQNEINGGEFNPGRRFYKDYKIKERLGETACTEIIAERLQTRLEQRQIQITPEHQLKDEKRADFTLRKRIENQELLLPVEVKGQWHENLYTAAAEQLHKFYSRHPNADFQGVYLVIWFGSHEAVAKRKKHGINSAIDLKESIEYEIPDELRNFIDVFVLDVSDV